MDISKTLFALLAGLGFTAAPAAAQTSSANEYGSTAISVEQVLDTHTDTLGRSFDYADGPPHILGSEIVLAAGASTPLHFHPVPLLVYVERGAIRVTYEGQEDKVYRAGDSLVEAINVVHQGFGLAPDGVRLIGFDLSNATLPSTVPLDPPPSGGVPEPLSILKVLMLRRLQLIDAAATAHPDMEADAPARDSHQISEFARSADRLQIDPRQAEHFIRMQIEAGRTLKRDRTATAADHNMDHAPAPRPDQTDLATEIDLLTPVLASLLKRVLDTRPVTETASTAFRLAPSGDAALARAWQTAAEGLAPAPE